MCIDNPKYKQRIIKNIHLARNRENQRYNAINKNKGGIRLTNTPVH